MSQYRPPEYPAEVHVERIAPEKIAHFQKLWKKENNYSGRPYNILADKAKIFINLCDRLRIPETQYPDIFPDILEDRAHNFYLHRMNLNMTWQEMYAALDTHFNNSSNRNQYWTDWTTLSFARCKQEHSDKSLHEVLEIMIDKMTLAQRALGREHQGESQLHTAVVRACRGQPELEPALFALKPTCEALFDDLRAAIQVTMDRQAFQFVYGTPDAFYTDRKYSSSTSRTSGRGRGRSFRPRDQNDNYSAAQTDGGRKQTSLRDRTTKKCFVCYKAGCWSTNHPRTERTRAKRQYISSYQEFHHQTPSVNEVAAYITSFEGPVEPTHNDDRDRDINDEDNEEWDSDIDNSDDVVQFLTATAYLHRTTGEDIYSVEKECNAQ